MSEKTIYLKDYRSPVFEVENLSLDFDLHDEFAIVQSQMKLRRLTDGALRLNGDELELLELKLNGQILQEEAYQFDGDDLLINDCPDECDIEIKTKIYPQKNTKLSGLYRSNHLFCTQCEAEGFRRITYFPDRPDVLTLYTTRIQADKKSYPVLLSNGNLIEQGELDEGRHYAVWQDPFKKPSYLFALVAGDLACIEDEFHTIRGRKVDLKIYVEHGNEDKCDHAMQSLKKSMKWDEDVYGREYDLDIFMIVAVSDFNMGAMENKGLNIFNSKYILARPDSATDQDFADIEGVVGHEYFHNWTGNRVTCRDWFQLSLKEGLTVFRDQEFSRDMNSRDVNRIMDVKVLRAAQFPEDAGSMAHPVRPEAYQEINNFYTATIYNKGAEVIRMQHTLLGEQGYRRGMDLYFERHDGQAVTIDDFVAAMEDANHVDFTQFKRWYSQAGTPEVTVESSFENGCLTLNFKQSCKPTPECQQKKPYHIPVRFALFEQNGERIAQEEEVLELTEAEQQFKFGHLAEKPVVSLLRDFSAPVKLNFPMSRQERLHLLRFETDGYAKWQAANVLTLECMHQWLDKPREQWMVDEDLLSSHRDILLDDSYDASLRAELLTMPGFQEFIADIEAVDVAQVEAIRDGYRMQLGQQLFDHASELYRHLWQLEDHGMYNQAYGRRKLRNICLWLMMKGQPDEAMSYCKQQFEQSKTMTDQLEAFRLLVNASEVLRDEAVEAFYQQWRREELVMDKWFSIQASAEHPDTLSRVRQLMAHPEFSFKNPNKVRSLIGMFCMGNHRNFHAIDGSGYAFLTEILLELDKYNPQVTARMATPFTRWQAYDKPRQELMKKELAKLASHSLSRDLNEMVEKSLA